MKTIKKIIGSILAAINDKTLPQKGHRSAEIQKKVLKEISSFSIYEFSTCPYCMRVRRALHRLNLPIELRNIKQNNKFRIELIEQGGKVQVPCLKIENHGEPDKWMYESKEIVRFLESKFSI